MKPNLLPLRLGAGMLVIIGLILLGCMFWIAGWQREGTHPDAAFVTLSLPGYRFKPEILSRLGEIGGGAVGLGFALLIVGQVIARRARKDQLR
jgi:hypothetical protein